ncbi:MAG: ketose-bisphosphate aldolase [Bdellovibrio bacteriovorus]
MLVHLGDMLGHAYRNGYAVGAFDLVSLDFLQAILAGAERQNAPVILSLAESHYAYFDAELLMPAVRLAAERAPVPVAIHLDHGSSLEAAIRGIRQGFNGVMVDASTQPLGENIARTRAVVEMAHACGVPVEGELGYVAGVEGEDAERHPGEVIYTAPEEAERYVRETGVDFLAVSIGTVHGRMRGEPRLDFERLAAINAQLAIPLVIHGGTGLGDDQFRRLIANGVAKINYYTALADAAGAAIRANAAEPDRRGYTDLTKGVQAAIQAEVERCIALWGGTGRAEEVLRICRPWREVEHLVIYNASAQPPQTAAMKAEGQRVLAEIPGVRQVLTGTSVREDAPYRHCWIVRFADAAVIDSYRDHPDHQAFADREFRPLAADRLTIDYQLDP